MSSKNKKTTKSLIQIRRREEKLDVLSKAFLIFRPQDFPLYLKPIRSSKTTRCAYTSKKIEKGEYVYPCHVNPLRIAPGGKYRVKINEVSSNVQLLLPKGYNIQLPSTEEIVNRVGLKKLEEQTQKLFSDNTQKLLSDNLNK